MTDIEIISRAYELMKSIKCRNEVEHVENKKEKTKQRKKFQPELNERISVYCAFKLAYPLKSSKILLR